MWDLPDLATHTRLLMLEEIEFDAQAGRMHLAKYLTEVGRDRYPELLRRAAANGTPESFSKSLKGLMRIHHHRLLPPNGSAWTRVPWNAHVTLGESEFNRYYVRAICRLAAQREEAAVEVIAATGAARTHTWQLGVLGRRLDAERLLAHLRSSVSVQERLAGSRRSAPALTVRLSR